VTAREIALENEILRGVVGSTAHGINIVGQDDRDEMGIFIEPPEKVCGLTPCDHYIYRDKPEGVRSGPGDLDLTLYSLRKFCRLATAGNPSVMVLLWLPAFEIKTSLGERLIGMRKAFISRDSGKRFLGYLTAQKQKLKGERSRTVNRPELVEKYGYDTKFAMHALRLGFEGIELLTDGKLTLPVAEPNLTALRSVRHGKINFYEALGLIEETENTLRSLVDACDIQADHDAINRFMVEAHEQHWLSRFSSTAERPAVVRPRQPGPSANSFA
jgi:predicted nucleotidyltransferase